MGLTRTCRFHRYRIHPDPTASPLSGAVCVIHSDPAADDAPECGALLGDWDTAGGANEWIWDVQIQDLEPVLPVEVRAGSASERCDWRAGQGFRRGRRGHQPGTRLRYTSYDSP